LKELEGNSSFYATRVTREEEGAKREKEKEEKEEKEKEKEKEK
jgi:hypothetical protein